MTSSRSREIKVSRGNLQSWLEAGLRQLGEIKNNEDLVQFFVIGSHNDLITIAYTVEKEEDVKVTIR